MRASVSQRTLRLAFVALLLTAPVLAGDTLATDPGRFQKVGQLTPGRADWVTLDGNRIAFGSGRRVHLANGPASPALRSALELDAPVSQGVLVLDKLYVLQGSRLGLVNLDAPRGRPAEIRLKPRPRGALHLARMVDYLVVAEDGLGLRVLALPPPDAMPEKHRRHFPSRAEQIALFPMEARFTAVTTSGDTIYAATDDGRIAVVLLDAAGEFHLSHLPAPGDVHAMAANGSSLYVLGDSGLTILDTGAGSTEGVYPDLRGTGISLAGRSTLLAGAGQGLVTFEDQAAAEATIFVTVGSFFFSPPNISINVGDTVQWDNGSGFHSTQACNGEANLCAGAVATEQWKGSSLAAGGNPAFAPWTFSRPFAVAGLNPYFCAAHEFSMFGTVTVSAALPPPPGTPDGTGLTTPMTVTSLNLAGSVLQVAWDTGTCSPDAADYQIISGLGSQLPAALGGTYGLSGSQCNIGTASPFVWIGVPDPAPDPSRFLWFLVVANDAAGTEGSWGKDGVGGERDGTGLNGSSGQCGINDKSLANACGQ